jgi:hypothetical protein
MKPFFVNTAALTLALAVVLAHAPALAQQPVPNTVPNTVPSVVTPLVLPANFAALGQSVTVDWTRGLVLASGRGLAAAGLAQAQVQARGGAAALADSERLLLLAIQNLQLTSDSTLAQCQVTQSQAVPSFKLRLEGLVRYLSVVKGSESYEKRNDGMTLVGITLSIPLYGNDSIGKTLVRELVNGCHVVVKPAVLNAVPAPITAPAVSSPTLAPAGTLVVSAIKAEPPTAAPVTTPAASINPISNGENGNINTVPPSNPPRFSSLVLNVEGLGFVPCLAPRVLAGEKVLWDGWKDEKRTVIAPTVMAATQMPEVGLNPLVLGVAGVAGGVGCDLQLGPGQMLTLASSGLSDFEQKTLVIVLTTKTEMKE